MGELFGLPEWLARTIFVIGVLATWFGIGFVLHRRGMRRLAVKRPNPARAEFIEMLSGDVAEATAIWLWDQARVYYAPLTPHPDDHLSDDAMIDDGDWSMDWPKEFAEVQGFNEKAYPDWPKEWPATIRNFGRWLDMGRVAGLQS